MRTKRSGTNAVIGALAFTLLSGISANSGTVIDFDSPDPGPLGSAFYHSQGVDFTGALILTSDSLSPGYMLYPLNPSFPPHSGTQVATDETTGVAIRATAVGGTWSSAGGYITGSDFFGNGVVTETAYDSANNVLGTASTPGGNYLGNNNSLSPNIFLNITTPGIAYVEFKNTTDDFTLDDFVFGVLDTGSTLPLVGLALAGLEAVRRGIREQDRSA
jgi:hypothetical protein